MLLLWALRDGVENISLFSEALLAGFIATYSIIKKKKMLVLTYHYEPVTYECDHTNLIQRNN